MSVETREPGITLADPQPRTLSTLDQGSLWGNLGISLLGPVTAVYVVAEGMSYVAALTAIVVGTVIGAGGVALANLAGARARVPAMVLLRGLFGTRLSYVPSVLNVVQLLGWGAFELIVIAAAANQLLPGDVTWPYVVGFGLLSTVMAVWPLGSVRVLRRFVLAAMILALGYLFVQVLREPLPSLTEGSFTGFWPGVDLVIAVSVSWIPLAADYSRHARSPRSAFAGSFVGFSIGQIAIYSLGVLAFATIGASDQEGVFAALIALPLGGIAFAIMLVREVDVSFADVYSTAVTAQNVVPRADRRVLAVGVGVVTTVIALVLDIGSYQNFLYLIGSVFVPMFAVLVVQFFVHRGWKNWSTGQDAPSRLVLLIPWVLGFVAYQIVTPGDVPGWSSIWTNLDEAIGFTKPEWLSASLLAFVVAFVAALPFKPRSAR